MKTILVTGHAGSGKTSIAIMKAVEMRGPEVLFVTDELEEMEFAVILDRIFKDRLTFRSGEAIIDGLIRITYRTHLQPVNPMGPKYDITICDTVTDISNRYYGITRQAIIVTKQMNRYHEIIVCEGVKYE